MLVSFRVSHIYSFNIQLKKKSGCGVAVTSITADHSTQLTKKMTSTRRLALPLRVHQIWDGIARASSENQRPVDYKRLMKILTKAHRLPRDEMSRELELAVRDQLVVSEVIQTQNRQEKKVYKLPDPKFSKGDHDWYCFHCHLGGGGPVVACEDCPRIFHFDCLPEDRKPQKDPLFVCPPCHIMATMPSSKSLNTSGIHINALLQPFFTEIKDLVIPFMEELYGETWAAVSGRDAKERWKYDYLVYFHIDITQIVEKASTGKYTSLEEYRVDFETLVHGFRVYSGIDQLQKDKAALAGFQPQKMQNIQEGSQGLSKAVSYNITSVVDAEDVSFLNKLQELSVADSLSGDAYFSNKGKKSVSEKAVLSSVNESSGSRNVYVKTNSGGFSVREEVIKECFAKHLASIKELHAQEILSLKKKQWCFSCEREAIYHCCWNTAYCSIACQQVHWVKEHKRFCYRKEAAN